MDVSNVQNISKVWCVICILKLGEQMRCVNIGLIIHSELHDSFNVVKANKNERYRPNKKNFNFLPCHFCE